MLVVGRGRGKEVMIGDHSVVTVVSLSNEGVKLGFETRDRVQRVDSPEQFVEAAKIKARMSHAVTSRLDDMEQVPVFVASTISPTGGAPHIKASFTRDKAHSRRSTGAVIRTRPSLTRWSTLTLPCTCYLYRPLTWRSRLTLPTLT